MNHIQFWDLIQAVNRAVPHHDHGAVLRETARLLSECGADDIADWHLIQAEYHAAAYQYDLWAASSTIGAHDTDDGFVGFRYWLISCGRDVYLAALQDPDSLFEVDTSHEDLCFEDYGVVAAIAYANITAISEEREDRITLAQEYLNGRELPEGLRSDLLAELPQRSVLPNDRSSRDIPRAFSRIYEKEQALQHEECAAQSKGDILPRQELVHAIGVMIMRGLIQFHPFAYTFDVVDAEIRSTVFTEPVFTVTIDDYIWTGGPAAAVASHLADLVSEGKVSFIPIVERH